jgi:hypothetical protein
MRELLSETSFTDAQKSIILEWYAWKIWHALEEGSGEPEYYCKSYDPMEIELSEKTAHSYVFDLEDGGRHHPFRDLEHLEQMMDAELIKRIKALAGVDHD